MQFMSELTGKTEDELYEDLKGVIFMNPEFEEDNTYLARKLLRQLEDYLLTLPVATSRCALCGGHYFVNYAFKFHNTDNFCC